jgi:hypothetical protein
MIASKRGWTSLFIKGCLIMVFLHPAGASGTFVAAIFSNDSFVIGADSRMVDIDGHTFRSDGVCKILLLNDSTVFALLGAKEYTPDKRLPLIQMYDLAKEAAAVFPADIIRMVDNFGDNAAAKLNSAMGRDRLLSDDFLLSMGIFGGLTPNNTFSIANVNLVYESAVNRFSRGPRIDLPKPMVFKIFLPHPIADEIGRSSKFQTISKRHYATEADKFASQIEFLVSEMIARNVSEDIGGYPSVLVLERGKRPRWHRKASDCPSLD